MTQPWSSLGSFTYDQVSLSEIRMTLLPGGNVMIFEADCAGAVRAVVLFFVTILVRGSGLVESLALERTAEELADSAPMKSRVNADFLYRILRIIRVIPIPISQRPIARRVLMNDSFDEVKI